MPVLSKTTIVILLIFSSTLPPLIKTPNLAATPVPTITAVGVANPSATINELRNEGHAIYLNTRTNSNGEKVSFYRLGTPTKRIVASGIAAMRSQGERAFA